VGDGVVDESRDEQDHEVAHPDPEQRGPAPPEGARDDGDSEDGSDARDEAQWTKP
jgi:hypothetical protein